MSPIVETTVAGRPQQDCRGQDRRSGVIIDGTAADRTRMAADGTGRDSHDDWPSDKSCADAPGRLWQDSRSRTAVDGIRTAADQTAASWTAAGRTAADKMARDSRCHDHDRDLVRADAIGTIAEQVAAAKVDAAQICQDHRDRRSHIRTGAVQTPAAGASLEKASAAKVMAAGTVLTQAAAVGVAQS